MLLDASMAPRTAWQLEAVMVLLNGHWPPRGLISGDCRSTEQTRPPAEHKVYPLLCMMVLAEDCCGATQGCKLRQGGPYEAMSSPATAADHESRLS